MLLVLHATTLMLLVVGNAGHCFESMDGQPAAQGYVTAQLHDKQSGRCLVVAATHLKAKAGVDNEQTRVHQVSNRGRG
jgi:hypothetical protein